MFELLCVISMALCKVLVLVNMGIFYFFFFFFSFTTKLSMGLFQVMFQDRYFSFYTVFVLGQKAKKLSQYVEVSFLKSSWRESWKGISTEGRQSSSGRFIQGTHFSRKDWPQHPWPAGQAAFLSQALFALLWRTVPPSKKEKEKRLKLIQSKSRWIPRFTRV